MKKHVPLFIVAAVGVLAVITVSVFYGDLLGARVLKKSNSRVVAYQGEAVTIQIKDSSETRKLELCVEKKNLLLGYSDFSDCQPLQYVVGPHVTSASVTIPSNFPLGRAVVVTRTRDGSGKLVAIAPSDEKITLLIKEARPVETVATTSSESSGGGGNSGGGGGGDSSDSPSRKKIAETIDGGCIEEFDREVHVSWPSTNAIIHFRIAGESTWNYPTNDVGRSPYYDYNGTRTALIFHGGSRPSSTSYPADKPAPGDIIELQLLPSGSYPDANNTDPSDIFSFVIPSFEGAPYGSCVPF